MSLDELMAVWRSQDAAPLHDMNKTLLHQALRQDEVRLQKVRRRERWTTYVASAGIVAAMAFFLVLMIQAPERYVMTSLDYGMGIVGAATALLSWCVVYIDHRRQARHEQSFGESLRDQLNRHIAQLDQAATSRTSYLEGLLAGISATAILFLGLRINQEPFNEGRFLVVSTILWCAVAVAGVRATRRQAQTDVLPRRRQLEALLKELDGQ